MNTKVKPKTQAPQSQNETAEAQVRSREELEQRVSERTSELEKSNMLLIKEILERRCAESELKQSLAEKDVFF